MGSAAEIMEPTTGSEKHHRPVEIEVEEEDEQIVELERKTPSFPHGKHVDSTDTSTITTTNTSSSSSSSFSGDGTEVIPDFRNGVGEHIGLVNLEIPESPEKETEIGFHEEGNNCNVYFDGEQGIWKCRHCDWTYKEESLLCVETKGSESPGAESDARESPTADRLNGEKKQSESVDGTTSEDNKGSREIEEVQDGDFPRELDVVDQPTGDVIEEEVAFEDAEYYEVEKVVDNQETHDLYCPNCNSCITKRVVLKRRKRRIPHVPEDRKRPRGPHRIDPLLHSEDNLPSPDVGENLARESFMFKCLSCFSIFIPSGAGPKRIPPSEGLEGLKPPPPPQPQEEATGDSNWFSSIFGFKKKEPAIQQVEEMPSIPEANPLGSLSLSGEDTTGSTANNPSKPPDLVQGGAATQIQVANAQVVNDGADVEDGQKFPPPLVEDQPLQKIDKDVASAANGNHASGKVRLSPMHPSGETTIVNTVTSGPEGVRVETVVHSDSVSPLFEGTDTSDPRKPDFDLIKVTGDTGVITGPSIPEIGIPPLPLSSLEEGSLTEPLVRPVVVGPVVEGRKLEVLKSIVYGGLIESITSLGVISSAAGSGASMLNILVLGLANLFGGLVLIIHNLQELRDEEPRIATTENNSHQEQGRYKRLLGRRENFTLHASVAVLSFIIVGLLPPVVYYFSFNKIHNRHYKVASVFGSSLLFIVLLAIAKAHVKTPRGSYLKSALYYTMIAVSVSGISYVVGNFVDQLLEKYGWSDGSETPSGHMMLSVMGRKAGSFGYSSSY